MRGAFAWGIILQVPHPGPGSLPAALMSVETEAQATRGFVHVRLAHGCSLGCSGAPGAAFGWVSGVGGWLAKMQWHHATTSIPPSFPFQPPLWCCNRHAQSHGECRDVPGAAVQHGEPPNKQSRHGDKWGRHGDGMGTEKERGSVSAPRLLGLTTRRESRLQSTARARYNPAQTAFSAQHKGDAENVQPRPAAPRGPRRTPRAAAGRRGRYPRYPRRKRVLALNVPSALRP